MRKSSQQILEEATREELSACVQLLAQSVVQHRVKFGVINLHQSIESDEQPAKDANETGLFIPGKELLEEALEIVRTIAAERAPRPKFDKDIAESRTQFRINVSIPIRVLWANESKPVTAKLENISWGGAAIVVNATAVDIDDSLRIILPRPQGGSISIEARILRTWDHTNDQSQGVSVRFSSLSTRDEAKLEDILEHFAEAAQEEGLHNHARLSQRLDIQFDGIAELQSTLDDIAAGGLGITVPEPMQIGQSLQAVISTLDESCSLKLRARVVRQESHKVRNVQFYQVGLKFEHPTEELGKRTQELISKMASITA